ncbi:flagellar basal body P-ring formation chaperone FlgA [Paracoccus sp. 1_MG-2023]|uniref:flagellar basal body P-ring formation chaperone FlgA n=1 Tax=unclassified Paracoccus (in: a-proteobacteria) TaxID=2688777 RepID=UPI001C083EF1|nr:MULTISPECIES: flagellar basal body P-ring formation chaperone FlgA [unclassified Paracoccus (in: a-proteobacteria)]MBU2956888.1 flagellar basal body P-ring formation chaperone FlgA [Paracoccus sp. C2R09]MDO6668086.1 flagellar basal body P-ring formation chaperone FlgA [Paracoccus sp. 1_MG-2023]
MRVLIIALALMPGIAAAGGLGAARTLPAGTIVTAADLRAIDTDRPGLTDPSAAIGMQTRITLYEGRPLHANMLQAPRLISRNQIVRLSFQRGSLRIDTEARALSDGAEGELIRAMNLGSKSQITAQVMPDGSLSVPR